MDQSIAWAGLDQTQPSPDQTSPWVKFFKKKRHGLGRVGSLFDGLGRVGQLSDGCPWVEI